MRNSWLMTKIQNFTHNFSFDFTHNDHFRVSALWNLCDVSVCT